MTKRREKSHLRPEKVEGSQISEEMSPKGQMWVQGNVKMGLKCNRNGRNGFGHSAKWLGVGRSFAGMGEIVSEQ
jgi:hypothetical protein